MAERRYTLVFYAAIVTAVSATYGVYRVLETTRAESRVPTRSVVVAAQDLTEGESLDRMALTVSEWPAATVPAGAYASLDSVAGRVTRVAVFKGEAIVPGRLAPPGTGPGLEVKIGPGKRAMAVKIDDVAGISGLIQPNSRVDVLVTLNDGAERERRVAKLFMENMRVLSVGTQVQRGADEKPITATSATLEVTPDEAERLAVATREGSVQLVLRGYGDPDSIKTKGARTVDVLAQLSNAPVARIEAPRPAPAAPRPRTAPARPAPTQQVVVAPPPAPARPDSLTVQVFRGDKVSQQKFEQKTP
jgi:pilus assembly protein CpaB